MDKVEGYVDAAASAIGLPIADEHRIGVVRYVQLAAGLAQQVMSFELSPEDEAANVFVPVVVRER
jgi:Protein of unknown function (DUF4089)